MDDPAQGAAPPLPVIACFKWGQGYPTLDTNVLFRAVTDLMSEPFRFVCITDDPDGLDDGIEAIALPPFALDRDKWNKGMWPKLTVFKPGLIAVGTPVLMVDVDVVVIRDLSPVFDRIRQQPGLHIIHDWHDTLERWFPRLHPRVRTSNSSVAGFVAGTQDQIWDAFKDAGWDVLQPQKNDQEFIHNHATGRHYWPDGWMLSFKKSLTWHVPVNFVRQVPYPHDAFIVAFHGKPNPRDVAQAKGVRWGTKEKFGYSPVPWVKDYLERYDRS